MLEMHPCRTRITKSNARGPRWGFTDPRPNLRRGHFDICDLLRPKVGVILFNWPFIFSRFDKVERAPLRGALAELEKSMVSRETACR